MIQEVQLQHKIPKDLIYLYSTKVKSIFITFFLENQINYSFMGKKRHEMGIFTHDILVTFGAAAAAALAMTNTNFYVSLERKQHIFLNILTRSGTCNS